MSGVSGESIDFPNRAAAEIDLYCGMPNGNVVKPNLSFYEWYGKGTYTVNDNFNFGGSI